MTAANLNGNLGYCPLPGWRVLLPYTCEHRQVWVESEPVVGAMLRGGSAVQALPRAGLCKRPHNGMALGAAR